MLLTPIWIGLAGALLMFAGDMLLYYTPEDFACDPKSSAKEKINAIIDVMKGLPAGRVMAGGMIGPVAAFLYCIGFYHIVLMANEQSHTFAMVAFLLSCFGIITGGAYHSHCAYFGLLGDDKDRAALEKVLAEDPRPAYQDDPERIYAFVFAERTVRFRVKDGVLTVGDIL